MLVALQQVDRLGKLVAPQQEGPVWELVGRLGKLIAPRQEDQFGSWLVAREA